MAGGGSKKAIDVFDLSRLTEIIELMKEHGLAEVDLQQDKQKIRLSRGGGVPGVAAMPMMAAAPQAAPAAPASAPAADNPNVVTINSPTVGTFYSRANPDTPPFVNVGDHVGPDTVVCIVEAMKVFNEIPAEISGQIVAVLVKDEEAVDFGKPLFKVDTSK